MPPLESVTTPVIDPKVWPKDSCTNASATKRTKSPTNGLGKDMVENLHALTRSPSYTLGLRHFPNPPKSLSNATAKPACLQAKLCETVPSDVVRHVPNLAAPI